MCATRLGRISYIEDTKSGGILVKKFNRRAWQEYMIPCLQCGEDEFVNNWGNAQKNRTTVCAPCRRENRKRPSQKISLKEVEAYLKLKELEEELSFLSPQKKYLMGGYE